MKFMGTALVLLLCLIFCQRNEKINTFTENDGLLVVEAEHFFKQDSTAHRQWYLFSKDHQPQILPDADGLHLEGASNHAYLEILPDSRQTHADPLEHGVSFSGEPGVIGILSYSVFINTPGRYYVWVRAFSTGTEDNGLFVGMDGDWPESGRRLQWCDGKHDWWWESKQRTEEQHCGVPFQIFLDVEAPGKRVVQFSMREDGFEFDKWLMTLDRDYRPQGMGPAESVKRRM